MTYGSAVNLENQTVPLVLDLYQPTGDTVTSRPAIVWVHGGFFSSGSKTSGELVDEATTFSEEGYVNVSINYRLESRVLGNLSNCIPAAQEAWRTHRPRCATCGTTRGARHRPHPHRHRWVVRGCEHRAERRLPVLQNPSSSVRAAVSISGLARGHGDISPGDAPALDFHCTTDPLVPYTLIQNTIAAGRPRGSTRS